MSALLDSPEARKLKNAGNMVGDGNSRHWTRYYGFTDPAVLVAEINRLSARRVHAKSTAIAEHHADHTGDHNEVQP